MIRCAPYTPADTEAFLTLHRACLTHYGLPPASQAQKTRVQAQLDSERHISCLMAWEGDAPLGFATWTLTLPAARAWAAL